MVFAYCCAICLGLALTRKGIFWQGLARDPVQLCPSGYDTWRPVVNLPFISQFTQFCWFLSQVSWLKKPDFTLATVNVWYIAPSHQFLKRVLSFFRFWYISKCYRFLKSASSFSKPQLNFQKKNMSRILLSIYLNSGCSSYTPHLPSGEYPDDSSSGYLW